MKIRELGQKAENLIEQGEQAKQQKVYYQQAAANARSQLAAARAMLDAASETDQEGDPKGDVKEARARVFAAQAMLDSAERGLAEASRRLEDITRGKQETVRQVERYTEGEDRNLAQLRELQNKRFGSNANAFVADLVARMNAGENMKERLLRSMGQSAAAKHYTAHAVPTGEAGGGGRPEAVRDMGGGSQYGGAGMGPGRVRQPDLRQYKAYLTYIKEYKKINEFAANNPELQRELLRELDEKYRNLAVGAGWITKSTGVNTLAEVRFPDQAHVSAAYADQVYQRINHAVPCAAKALQVFGKDLEVVEDDFNIPGAPSHYAPKDGFYIFNENIYYEEHGVHYNAAEDEKNPYGAGTTLFYELGCMMNHVACGYDESLLSDNLKFWEALREDGKRIEESYDRMPEQNKQKFLERLQTDCKYGAVSDLIGGLTDGRIDGHNGYTKEYDQKDQRSISHAAFAHFFEAAMGSPEKQEVINTFFSQAYGCFLEILKEAVGQQPELIKRR